MKMNIACSTDDRFAPYCGIMLTSLFENNKKNSFSVYIMSRDLSEENRTKFDTLARRYSVEINILDMNKYEWRNCPIREEDYISIETYFRLVLPDALPHSVHKILYLDSDIIINAPIDSLYMQDIRDVPLGACTDLLISDEVVTLLGIEKKKYFNAGVLLINIDYFRSFHLLAKCYEIINSCPDKLRYCDQDVLNLVTYRNHQIRYLDTTYNFLTTYSIRTVFNSFPEDIKRRVARCAQNPAIIHFTSPEKPWHKLYASLYKSLFFYYKEKSLWADTPLQKNYRTLKQYLGWHRVLLEIKIGLRKPPYMTMKELRKLSNL